MEWISTQNQRRQQNKSRKNQTPEEGISNGAISYLIIRTEFEPVGGKTHNTSWQLIKTNEIKLMGWNIRSIYGKVLHVREKVERGEREKVGKCHSP